jgi:hypothetical protein
MAAADADPRAPSFAGFGLIGLVYYRLTASVADKRDSSDYWNSNALGAPSHHH